MNDGFKVVRIQTVNVDGKPQDFDEILSHSRWSVGDVQTQEDWEKHLDGIKNLGVLANQASEFEYKKNLTEGKTGIVQPDLISSKNIEESLLNVVTSPDTPKKKMLMLEKTGDKILGLKVELERQELLKSPLNPTASFPKSTDVQEPKAPTPESPKFPTMSPAKSPTPSVKSKISNEPLSPKFPTGSPAKKQSFIINDKPSIVKMEPKVAVKVEENVTKVEPKVNPVEGESKTVKIESPQESIEAKKPQSYVKESTANFLAAEKKTEVPVTIPSPTKSKPPNLSPISTQEPQQVTQAGPKLPASKSSQSFRRKKQRLMAAKPPNILVFSDSITTRDNVIKTLGSILQKNTYTIYPLSAQQVRGRIWLDNTSLLVVCGSVNGSDLGSIFLDFFFKGGKVLCLCSDLLRHVLPTYHTAEVDKSTNLSFH